MSNLRARGRFVPPNHPLRAIRPLVDAALDRLSGDFTRMCSAFGRESIAPENRHALVVATDLTPATGRVLYQPGLGPTHQRSKEAVLFW